MARTTAESMPPETRATAFFMGTALCGVAHCRAASGSAPRLVVPEDLVQLHLEAHRQAVGDDPVGQVARLQLALGGREQHVAACGQAVLGDHVARPLVVGTAAQPELDL